MNSRRDLFDLLVLANCTFILSGAITTLTLTPGDTPLEGNAFGRLMLSISYLAVGVVLLPYRHEAFIICRRNWTLLALIVLAFASCLWAETPEFTFRRCIAVAGTTLFGIALAVRLSLQQQLRLLSVMFRVIAVLSLACIILLPSYGISDSLESEWRGVFGYKNAFGSIMAISSLVEWQLPTSSWQSKLLNRAALLLSVYLLIRANSITPLLAFAGAVVLVELYKCVTLRLRIPLYATAIATLLVSAVIFVLIAPRSDAFAAMLGRSSDLTGRTEIWRWVVSFIQERPLLGYGYSGFWSASAESGSIERAIGRHMYSHNGYLETFLTMGAVGFLLAVRCIVGGMKRAYQWSTGDSSQSSLWPLAFLLFFLLYNLGECTIFLQDLQWGICVAIIAATDAALFAPPVERQDEIYLNSGEKIV